MVMVVESPLGFSMIEQLNQYVGTFYWFWWYTSLGITRVFVLFGLVRLEFQGTTLVPPSLASWRPLGIQYGIPGRLTGCWGDTRPQNRQHRRRQLTCYWYINKGSQALVLGRVCRDICMRGYATIIGTWGDHTRHGLVEGSGRRLGIHQDIEHKPVHQGRRCRTRLPRRTNKYPGWNTPQLPLVHEKLVQLKWPRTCLVKTLFVDPRALPTSICIS